MSCDVAALPFKAQANYVTWSIDFGKHNTKLKKSKPLIKSFFKVLFKRNYTQIYI